MLLSIILLSFTINLALILAPTPLTLGIWILLLAISITISITFFISSWFRFITFLIYVGGILVIFAYFIALQPNQPLIIQFSIFTLIISFIIFSTLPFFQVNIPFSTSIPFITSSFIILKTNIFLFWILRILLFIALIIVVKLSQTKNGPLRPFNFYV